MLKRALCQAAREHPQTMAGVGLGCRRCHQAGECSSGCQGAPTGWQTCVRLSGDKDAHPPGVGALSSCKDHQESLLLSEPSKALWPGGPCRAVEQPTAPCSHTPLGLDPRPLLVLPGGPKSQQTQLRAAAPLRRSLLQSPHGCQSSGDNELLMCLKSDAGCMARS